jgi:NTE family protein
MKKVGLVLGSGGSRGGAHLGVIKVLHENKIPVDMVSGASIGALVAAYYALHKKTDWLQAITCEFKKKDILRFVDINDPRVSFIKGKKIMAMLQALLGDATFEDTRIPLRIVATSLKDGSPFVFTSGRLVDAVMASATVPGVMPPFKYKDEFLVDGGLSDALPVDLVKNLGAEAIIAVDLYAYPFEEMKDYGMGDVIERTLQFMISKLSLTKDIDDDVIVLKPMIRDTYGMFDFSHSTDNVKEGEKIAQSELDRIKKLVGGLK